MKTQVTNDELRSTRFKQKKLIARTIDDELLLFDEEASTAHCLNGIAGEMWMACERQSSAAQVTDFLCTRWPDIEKEIVWASLSKMAAAGLLEETTGQEHISTARREARSYGRSCPADCCNDGVDSARSGCGFLRTFRPAVLSHDTLLPGTRIGLCAR